MDVLNFRAKHEQEPSRNRAAMPRTLRLNLVSVDLGSARCSSQLGSRRRSRMHSRTGPALTISALHSQAYPGPPPDEYDPIRNRPTFASRTSCAHFIQAGSRRAPSLRRAGLPVRFRLFLPLLVVGGVNLVKDVGNRCSRVRASEHAHLVGAPVERLRTRGAATARA